MRMNELRLYCHLCHRLFRTRQALLEHLRRNHS